MLVQHGALGQRNVSDREHDATVLDPGEARRCDVVWPVLGNHDQVGMRHPVPVYDHPDALGTEHLPHPPADPLRHDHDALGGCVVHVGEVIDVLERDDRAFSGGRGVDGHEGDNQLVSMDHAGGRRATDNFAEDAGHASSVLSGPTTRSCTEVTSRLTSSLEMQEKGVLGSQHQENRSLLSIILPVCDLENPPLKDAALSSGDDAR